MTAPTGPVGHPIRVVAQRTGLTTAAIRAWERRYEAVTPARSPAGQRVYSESDLQRLELLAALVRAGHAIGTVARLPTERLTAMAEEEAAMSRVPGTDSTAELEALVGQALELVEALRPDDLEKLLMRAAVAFRTDELIGGLLVPLLREIGNAWQTGRFGPGSEHVASVTIRRFLEWLSTTIQVRASSPLIVTGTPAGQRHEFGALLAGLVAADEGWRVRFLGPDLPADEIARGALTFGADAVALSALYPPMSREAVEDVVALRARLPARVEVIIGGRAAEPHAEEWERYGVRWHTSLDEYRRAVHRGLQRRA